MYVREDGEQVIAAPHDPLYSTVTMCATHFWRDGQWVPIHTESEDDDA